MRGSFCRPLTYLTARDLCNKDGGMKSYHSKFVVDALENLGVKFPWRCGDGGGGVARGVFNQNDIIE